jgi:alpha-mannosidase
MTRLRLREEPRSDGIAALTARLPPQTQPVAISYRTRTGAVLKVDGVTAGAFDREHHEAVLPPSTEARDLTIEVDLYSLPTNGLPSGPGVIWWFLNARAHEAPRMKATVVPCHREVSNGRERSRAVVNPLPCIGHSHLDVAWLWTYEQTHRKAQRTFAIACDLLDRDEDFIFAQSQPQLYAFVQERDPQLFERVREHVAANRFDPDVAALWVESDCNVPSGESLLRQMLYAHEYCVRHFGRAPRIAWLPDTFGFCNTLPQLLAHAGIPYFATTKLNWNDTTRFTYAQFRWRGPGGSEVVAALIRSYDGGAYPWRVRTARERNEPLVLGYGDGGGGVTPKMLGQVREIGEWIHPGAWFETLDASRETLPVHEDEMYLEYHRGVQTTHHDVKFHNALLERALAEAEELLAWCVAVHAPRSMVDDLAKRLHAVWTIVLRNQFHDVLPGTSIEPVYESVREEYAQAEAITASVITSAQSMLPRGPARSPSGSRIEPSAEDGVYAFDNGIVHARVAPSGALLELTGRGGRNVFTQGNVLALYRDTPKQWEAWNIDASYRRGMRRAQPGKAFVKGGSLTIEFLLGNSPAEMTVSLFDGEPFVRVDLDVDWKERRTLLRMENWLALQVDAVRYGTAHGSIVRSTLQRTPQERAKFEVPGQRYAAAIDAAGAGAAILSLDCYGWSARSLPQGGLQIGHSLLRGTCWPDEHADLGEHRLSYAFMPAGTPPVGALERAWLQFAQDARVRLFTCDDPSVLVVACKPAHDGDGVVVRVRETDGAARQVALRSGARCTQAIAVDALERAVERSVRIERETLIFDLAPYELRTFRVRFTHA